ncbi:MAG: PEGA domain-containing protein [Acidobacteriota bacterium]
MTNRRMDIFDVGGWARSRRWSAPMLAAMLAGVVIWAPSSAADTPKIEHRSTQSSGSSSAPKASPQRRSSPPPSTARAQSPPRSRGSSERARAPRAAGPRDTSSGVRRQHRHVERNRGSAHHRGYKYYNRHERPHRYRHHRPYRYHRYYPKRHYYPSYYRWGVPRFYSYWGPFAVHAPYWPSAYVGIGGGGIGHRYSNGMGALDLDVSPEKAEIYIDGQYVGVADEYDGFPQYLWLEKGTYDVAIYREGYETIVRQYSIYPGVVIDVSDRMKRGIAIDPEELMTPKSTVRRDERLRRNEERRAEVEYQEEMERRDAEPRAEAPPRAAGPDEMGRLFLRAWPADAAVYLDGHFLGVADELYQLSAGLLVEPGEHVLQIMRPGFGVEERTIDVPPGDRLELELELEEQR